MGVTAALQRRLLAGAGVRPERMAAGLHVLRCAAQLFGDAVGPAPLYVRHNRAARGALREGDAVPRLTLHHPADGCPVALADALRGGGGARMPTLLVSGSWT
mmetsp:Transcript_29674/g.81539  ORF Transcript_29674/g.81539 Transcript_29674/m.81539 type:complete len:102 (+) Transcript_29674:833-1138(+)